jgi:hypothetical protein
VDRRVPFPTIPEAPREYSPRWGSDLVRSLDQILTLLYNPGEGRFTTAVFTNLPSTDAGLENGSLVLQGDQVFIVVPYKSRPVGVSAAVGLGNVTVTV